MGNAETRKGERGKKGAELRAKAGNLKTEFDKLERELKQLAKPPQQEVTQKSITQWQDDWTKANEEMLGLWSRAFQKSPSNGLGDLSRGSSDVSMPPVSFTNATSADGGRSPAELQPVSNRALLKQQQETMRDIEAGLDPLESSVRNLGGVSKMISTEVADHNQTLDAANNSIGRVNDRMARVQDLMGRVGQSRGGRALECLVIVLFALLVFVTVKAIMP